MDIEANRVFGQYIFGLWRQKLNEHGHDCPYQTIHGIGPTFDALIQVLHRQIRQGASIIEMEETSPAVTPQCKALYSAYRCMGWLSLVSPGDTERLSQLPRGTSLSLREYGLEPLDDGELDALRTKTFDLHAQQQEPGKIGAAGEALRYAAMLPLKGNTVPRNTHAARRRRQFEQRVLAICTEVEVQRNLADRKAAATRLGGILAAELRASRVKGYPFQVTLFWERFKLFFGSSRYAG